MSRTDKDAPYWVRAEWYEPFHQCGWFRTRKYRETNEPLPWYKTRFRLEWTGRYEWIYRGDCDLPEQPTRSRPDRFTRRRKTTRLCSWEPEWPDDFYSQARGRNMKFWRRSEFYGPQRMNERLAEREVIKGNIDYEFPDGRGRHSVLWDLS